MSEVITKVKNKTNVTISKPSRYKVIMFNDDKTTVDFVILLLTSVFKHSDAEAENITLKIHNEGSCVVGIYNFEIAEQKATEATLLARQNGFPLVIKVETE